MGYTQQYGGSSLVLGSLKLGSEDREGFLGFGFPCFGIGFAEDALVEFSRAFGIPDLFVESSKLVKGFCFKSGIFDSGGETVEL